MRGRRFAIIAAASIGATLSTNARAQICSPGAAPSVGVIDTVTCTSAGRAQDGSPIDKCRVDNPDVMRRWKEYPQIVFHKGDKIHIDAGGCAQTGGLNCTWKRFVDPSGPNADRLYHGLIRIPGTTPGLVRLQSLRGQDRFALVESTLHLGYEDDDYSSNGYWGRDVGTGYQCQGQPNAWVELTITRAPQHPLPPVKATQRTIEALQALPAFDTTKPDWAKGVCRGGRFLADDDKTLYLTGGTVDGNFVPTGTRTPNWSSPKAAAFEWTPIVGSDKTKLAVQGDPPFAPGADIASAVSGAVIEDHNAGSLSGKDLWFSHPFGNDFEFYLSVDPAFDKLLAPGNKTAKCDGCGGANAHLTCGAVNVTCTCNEAFLDSEIRCEAEKLGLAGPPGVLGVEWDSGLVPYNYRPHTGDRAAVFGSWVVDCGHADFHTEMHPPLLLANARSVNLDTTHVVVISRPYTVSQMFTLSPDDHGFNGNGVDGPMMQHIALEMLKGIQSRSRTAEVHAKVFDNPFFAANELHLMHFVVRPPTPRRGPGDKLQARYYLTARPGVTAQVTFQGDDVHVWLSVNEIPYSAGLRANNTTMPARTGSFVTRDQFGNPDAEAALKLLGNIAWFNGQGVISDLYDPPQYPALLETDGFDAAVDGKKIVDGRAQPYPIFGWITVSWLRDPSRPNMIAPGGAPAIAPAQPPPGMVRPPAGRP